jgi:P-type Ca2+ transporter type 2C
LWVAWSEGPGVRATTVAFVAIALIQPLQAMRCRSTSVVWWRLPPNALIWISLVVLGVVQWLAVATPPLQSLLGTQSLDGRDWFVVALSVLWPVCIMEAAKAFRGSGAPPGRSHPSVAAP